MIGILVAANKEWAFVKEYFKDEIKELKPYIFGEYFETTMNGKEVLIFKSGPRKSNASASVQYIIDRFNPEKLILAGTAAGVNNRYSLTDILVPDTAIQSDGDFIERGQPFRDRNITHIDLSKYSVKGNQTIASRDKPLVFKEDCELLGKYNIDIAMHRALDELKLQTELLLIDGNRFNPYKKVKHVCIVGGDAKYQSIAAASILAKTTRDMMMEQYGEQYPVYNWKKNKGYPTPEHKQAIADYGTTPLHRMTFNMAIQLKLDF